MITPVRVVALVALLVGHRFVNHTALGLRVAVATKLGLGNDQLVRVLLHVRGDVARFALSLRVRQAGEQRQERRENSTAPVQ